MLEFLIPVSENHSVDKCIIALHMPQEIINIKDLFDRLNKENHFIVKYQRRVILYSQVFNFRNENNRFNLNEKSDELVAGFVFEQYNENGDLANSILLKNERNKAVINFETRNYNRWNDFLDNFLEDYKFIIPTSEFYFESLDLTYIDEFLWNSLNSIPVTEIFEEKSELINSKFLNSKNGTIIILSQKENLNVEERTELSFNNEFKNIQIIHQYVNRFNKNLHSEELLIDDLLITSLEAAHTSNKEMLDGLLTKQIKDLIKLI